MKVTLVGVAVLFLVSACASGTASGGAPLSSVPRAPSRKELVRRILQHNVRVIIYEGDTPRRTASGVVIGSEPSLGGAYSYVLTNAHVLDPGTLKSPRIAVVVDPPGHEPVEYNAEPAAIGKVPELDLALLRVQGAALIPADLAGDAELEPGEDVMVVAAPYGKAISLSGGIISQVEWDRVTSLPRMLKTDAPIGYGASGGGIYSRSTGKLVAIVEGYRTAKVGFAVAEQSYSFDVPMPGETFGAPTAKVRAFLQQRGFQRFLAHSPAPLLGAAQAAMR